MTDPRRSNRRDFLRGKSAADAVADAADRLLEATGGPAEPLPELPSDVYLLQIARRAMACQFEIYLTAKQYEHGSEVALEALDLVEQLEDQMTVYRGHSEISQINRTAAAGPVNVEARLFELLRLAVEIHAETGGAYDITSGPLSQVWGFTRRAGAIPDAADLRRALERVGSQHLELAAEDRTIRFLKPEMELNLGSIGKGYALDRVGELLSAAGIEDVLVHGGHSSVLARGSHGATPGQGWSVGVRNPLRLDHYLGEIRLRDRALATSGSGTQFFIHEGQRYGHILDPRTGWPAQEVLTSTVIAPTAALAEALSTAFYVLGSKQAEVYCQQHAEISAILVCPPDRQLDKRSGTAQVHTFGMSQSNFDGERYVWS